MRAVSSGGLCPQRITLRRCSLSECLGKASSSVIGVWEVSSVVSLGSCSRERSSHQHCTLIFVQQVCLQSCHTVPHHLKAGPVWSWEEGIWLVRLRPYRHRRGH